MFDFQIRKCTNCPLECIAEFSCPYYLKNPDNLSFDLIIPNVVKRLEKESEYSSTALEQLKKLHTDYLPECFGKSSYNQALNGSSILQTVYGDFCLNNKYAKNPEEALVWYEKSYVNLVNSKSIYKDSDIHNGAIARAEYKLKHCLSVINPELSEDELDLKISNIRFKATVVDFGFLFADKPKISEPDNYSSSVTINYEETTTTYYEPEPQYEESIYYDYRTGERLYYGSDGKIVNSNGEEVAACWWD